MASFFCLAAEIQVLEHLDSLRLYLTYPEIAVVAGIVLVIYLCAAVGCWAGILVVMRALSLIPALRRNQTALGWYLSVGTGLCCFLGQVWAALKLLLPRWGSSLFTVLIVVSAFVGWRVAGEFADSVRRVQNFGRHRLLPIFWVHLVLAVVTVALLLTDGTRLFRDYAKPGRATAASQLPDIYLITADALNAEDCSVYGYGRPTTPNLQRFAQRSFVFDNFFANANFTTPATTSIATGKLPWSHRVFHFSGFLRGDASHENLATLLHQRGYYTAIINSNYAASPILHRTLASYDAVEYVPPSGSAGYWLRFTNLVGSEHQYILNAALPNRLDLMRSVADALIWPHRYPDPAEEVFGRARSLLERSDIGQPHFLWTHVLPPHDPYLPPPLYRNQFLPANSTLTYRDFLRMRDRTLPPGVSAEELRARYDEMVLYADDVVGHFLDWLDETGRLDRAIVIISADHGESFEHEWFFHGGQNLNNELIHVPLLVHLPGQHNGARVAQLAQQADLLPTLMDLINGEVPGWTDGISLKPALEGKPTSNRFVFSMNLESNRIFDPISKGTVAILNDEFKYITWLGPGQQQEALYRYKTDPLEEHDLAQSEPNAARVLNQILMDKLKEINQRRMTAK